MNETRKYHVVYVALTDRHDANKVRVLLETLGSAHTTKTEHALILFMTTLTIDDINVLAEFMAENMFDKRRLSYLDGNREFVIHDDFLKTT